MIGLTKGQRGRFRASGREFEITDCTRSSVTAIRWRGEREAKHHPQADIYVDDSDLREAADAISTWGGEIDQK